MARGWLMFLGWTLLVIAILGLIPAVQDGMHDIGFHVEGGEDVLHWVLAAATLAVAYFVRDEHLLATITIVFGVVYLATGALGFFVDEMGPWHVGMGDNLLHLALGAISLTAGVITRNQLRGGVDRDYRSPV